MAYLALYRKYRPQTFSEVISQPHITITLQNQIKSGQIAHAYLFTGSRGTGKTTCAKILAKAVNCVGNDAPCLTCESCLAADNSPDIQEIDAASNNGVEDIRALREEAGYLPSELKYKVYIIDEVHMLSTSAFNALLKTLEEPPAHVIFILATTESHKIPATVLSRCQRFEFNRINAEESADALMKIAENENITLEKEAALLISRLSDGGMRDALSLLDVAASENGVITQDVIRDCAGIAGKEHLFGITDSIASGDGKTALATVSGLYAKSKDPSRLIDELLQHFRNLMVVKLMPNDYSLLTALPEEIPDYIRQAGLFSLKEIIQCLDNLEDCLRLKGRRVEAEICLMKMCVNRGTVVEPMPLPRETNIPEPVPVPAIPLPVPVPAVLSPVPIPSVKPIGATPATPFPEWQSVLDRLDAYRASMMEETAAGLSGNTVIVTGGSVLEYFFGNQDNISALTEAVQAVTGKTYAIQFRQNHTQTEPDIPAEQSRLEQSRLEQSRLEQSRLEQFFTQARTRGIEVKIN